jgi:hypothetical protein
LASSQLAANPASVLRNEATLASSDRAPLSRRSKLFSGLSLAFASDRNVDVLLENKIGGCSNATIEMFHHNL